MFQYLKHRFARFLRLSPPNVSMESFDTYEPRAPSLQNCVDAVPGWNSRFPDEYGVVAGNIIGFADGRIKWALEQFGPIDGAKVLEIGPMEGAHTYLLDRRGANVTAVEANKRAFLKCLITKEICGLPRAKFLLGDCVLFLEETSERFDLIVACGVLYHMRNPVRFLKAAATKTDALYLWTSYIDDQALPAVGPVAEAFAQMREAGEIDGRALTLYRRGYSNTNLNPEFCGGIYDDPRWLNRQSILDALDAVGFSSLEIAHENTPNPYESCFSIFARRK